MKIFMFVNVDWFYLSHRQNIAKYVNGVGHEMSVFAEITNNHSLEQMNETFLSKSHITRSEYNLKTIIKEFYKTFWDLKNNKPDLVHAVTIKPILIVGLIARFLNIPFVGSVSGLGPAFHCENLMQRFRLILIIFLYRFIFCRHNSGIICQSQHDVDKLLEYRVVRRAQITKINSSGVDIARFSPEKREGGFIKVLMASRLIKSKGVWEYIQAARRLKAYFGDRALFFIAGAIDKHSLGSLTENEMTEIINDRSVKFLGNLKKLETELNTTDIFVLPSYYPEGVPKVLIEASSSGCAILTTDHPGCREAILPNVTGLLVQPRNSDALYNELKKMISQPKRIKEMGYYGRKFIMEKHNEVDIAKAHLKLYSEVSKGIVING